MGTSAAFLPGLSAQEALPIAMLPVVGTALLVGIFFYLRRFGVDERPDGCGGEGGGGGEGGPRPGGSPRPLAVPDPPLGEIRASRSQSPAGSRKRR